MKNPVIVANEILERVIDALADWEQASRNGGDRQNLKDARNAERLIRALRARQALAPFRKFRKGETQ